MEVVLNIMKLVNASHFHFCGLEMYDTFKFKPCPLVLNPRYLSISDRSTAPKTLE